MMNIHTHTRTIIRRAVADIEFISYFYKNSNSHIVLVIVHIYHISHISFLFEIKFIKYNLLYKNNYIIRKQFLSIQNILQQNFSYINNNK